MPGCALTTLWEQTIGKGAPASAVAGIEYTADGDAFSIAGTDWRIKTR